ncbi:MULTISPECIES: DUF3841 domain-containing protein [Aerococcus]|uniref:DUF3841 domain-containing protein n=1 Tax=Aerococcus sanguinicola TaxID=119206 RepID=A0A5N1GM26_9LACT|nr:MULTISPECIES: DUF3841 domain-containing protein [Aerococcus]KAA9302023.1 DUF3841 domain-containing protein [Aerococcus sanguinicola]MDK6368552.1 DUF3841 domain-containing protein [Aerococcus sp. UMB9870]MDK6679635.1 DUF3841 domain-containing protein [Aerococcus sp. UMB8608]MDK6686479.1 DUF3841 domain-containing protein [Aerococcus sp. UMB8623]MDK6940899.1 DUF3841 domain-containing protein [Aerococcus sp. UMB8487]
MEYIRLYTRQHENSLYELERTGSIRNKSIYVRLHMGPDADYFAERYRSFVEMAEERIPRPEGVEYPIWCAISKDTARLPIKGEVLYCLRVPKDQVIFFDGQKWDYVLNYLYIPSDEADQSAFKKELQARGLPSAYNIIKGKYAGFYPDLEEKIRASWTRIFDIDEPSRFKVQANLWEIQEEWIETIIYPGEDLAQKTQEKLDAFGQ